MDELDEAVCRYLGLAASIAFRTLLKWKTSEEAPVGKKPNTDTSLARWLTPTTIGSNAFGKENSEVRKNGFGQESS